MANYVFETITSDQAASFDSGADTLRFTTGDPSTVTFTERLGNLEVASGGKTVTFAASALSGADIQFTSSFNAASDATVFLGTTGAETVTVDNTDDGNYAYGLGGADTVVGNSGDDYLFGGTGADSVVGLSGDDYAFGGAGDDIIDGGSGADHLYGFALTGTFSLDGDDNISGGIGNDYLQGNAGEDTLSGGSQNDRINGGADNDVISGDDGSDTVNGNKGEDTINGNDGNDSLRGGADNDVISGDFGNDVIQGDLGDDTISGGDGIDVLTGGNDNDTFVFVNSNAAYDNDPEGDLYLVFDTITDFTAGDLIDLTDNGVSNDADVAANAVDILTSSSTVGSLSDAVAIATGLLTNNAGSNEVAAIQVGSDTYVFYDGGDQAIKLAGVAVASVTADDFAEISA